MGTSLLAPLFDYSKRRVLPATFFDILSYENVSGLSSPLIAKKGNHQRANYAINILLLQVLANVTREQRR